MENKIIGLDFELGIDSIEDINPSFSKATVRICYTGENRNMSKLSKSAIEKALPSLKNVPIVGRYLPEENDFSGHDIIVTELDDGYKVENATTPFGVIPESANQYWQTITDQNNEDKEYLCTEAILWKRQRGYETLVENAKWNQSMEIAVTSFVVDSKGCCDIQDFYFEALCILGTKVEPCFEEASLMLGKKNKNDLFSKQFELGLNEFKNELNKVDVNKWFGKKEIKQMEKSKIKEIFDSFDLVQADTKITVSEDETEFSLKEKIYSYQISALKAENKTLKSENETFTKEVHDKAISEINERFEKIAEVEEFKALQKKASEMSTEDYEKECFVILGKNSLEEESKTKETKKNFSFAKQTLKEPEVTESFDDFMEKYGK